MIYDKSMAAIITTFKIAGAEKIIKPSNQRS
jgi:hypothetical protein